MTLISLKRTWVYKRLFPILWFGVIAAVLLTMVFVGKVSAPPIIYVTPVFLLVLGFVLMRKLVWDLADEVYDAGDHLVVKSRGIEERVPLSSIINVNSSVMVNPPRVVLRLDKPGRFGNEIVFSPQRRFSLDPFAKNAMIDDLILRVDRARRGATQTIRGPTK